ncbi:spore germination protein, partial [Virgibacillus salexigens]|uniref:spore germination protein n=1 Tax=Virgibacillus salexigens TaxID=61016 RepID=UPI00190A412F
YIDGLSDTTTIEENVLKNLEVIERKDQLTEEENSNLLALIHEELISITGIQNDDTMDDLSLSLLSGGFVFLLDGVDRVLLLDTKKWESRSILEPVSKSIIRGPREGIVEN